MRNTCDQSKCRSCIYATSISQLGYMHNSKSLFCDYARIHGRSKLCEKRYDPSLIVSGKNCSFYVSNKPKKTHDFDINSAFDKIMKLYEQGLTDDEIAEHLNTYGHTIRAWRNQNGLPANVNHNNMTIYKENNK